MTPLTTGAPRPIIISLSDAHRLDGDVCRLADELEHLALICDDWVNQFPKAKALREVARCIRAASRAMVMAKNPARQAWIEAHAAEGSATLTGQEGGHDA
ncbi:hypothetical protein [Methylococcus geothermalis]|uniref:Uncharacterized protein n=1 Tax=Methylococcus geothermalis TaxID=2681310 RepID=A0A858Q8N3_9GAMM|nr:hypothetical protein [Methylococcus geothermalis]QJD30187.1 hypothetical protein GNH96_09530 [Methylococcus geothermalis]